MSATKRRPGYRTKSGAVKLQVLLHPKEYQRLVRGAREEGISISFLARYLIAQALVFPAGTLVSIEGHKYQPRGFAR